MQKRCKQKQSTISFAPHESYCRFCNWPAIDPKAHEHTLFIIIADLDGDGRPDIIATGRQTSNVRIYWNEGRK
jgi:hypothetical protein